MKEQILNMLERKLLKEIYISPENVSYESFEYIISQNRINQLVNLMTEIKQIQI